MFCQVTINKDLCNITSEKFLPVVESLLNTASDLGAGLFGTLNVHIGTADHTGVSFSIQELTGTDIGTIVSVFKSAGFKVTYNQGIKDSDYHGFRVEWTHDIEPTTYISCDGVSAQLSPYDARMLSSRGYTHWQALRGKVGYSELAMHTGKAECYGVRAFYKKDTPSYGWVLLSDGSTLQGCLTIHKNNTFSVS